MRLHVLLIAVLASAPVLVQAQAAVPLEFPEGSSPLAPEALKERVGGRVFAVKLADGTGWRLDYKAGGYYFVDTTTGGRDDGRWRVEGTRLCNEAKRGNSGCNEAREKDGVLYLKRTNGEVIALTPR